MKRVLFIILGLLVSGISIFLLYFQLSFPKITPAPEIKVDMSEANIKRGEYLANNVTVCMDCHSTRDWSKFSGPIKEGTLGMGGEEFTEKYGLPGNFYSKNITPAKLGNWTDGEIYRAIVSGISKDGSTLFPIMPYHNYAKMQKDDILAIIAYLRSLKPIENEVKASKAKFPMNMIMKIMPHEITEHPKYDLTNKAELGKYIYTAASCGDCHTKMEKGVAIPGMDNAGGMEFMTPMGLITTANITPDTETGIGKWTKEQFIARFKAYSDITKLDTPKQGEKQSIMPWNMYAGMSEDDLGALFEYIMTFKPVKNKVVTFKAM